MEGEALTVHASGGVRAEEGDGLGEVFGGGEGGAVRVRILFTHLGSLDRVDDDDVRGGGGAGERVGEGEGPCLGGGLARCVGGVGVRRELGSGGGDEDEA